MNFENNLDKAITSAFSIKASLTYVLKRGTNKDYPHKEVYLEGEYIGYIINNTWSLGNYHTTDGKWTFDNKTDLIPVLHARTQNELKRKLEEAVANPEKAWEDYRNRYSKNTKQNKATA